ncbi:hypothetical protein [Dialister micraerophilus]|nr:hypothetical protein [Dialister micraerophilus]MDU5300866.1 hypothetical protein [Dialister micraerophilus]
MGSAFHIEPIAWKMSIPFKLIQNDLGYFDLNILKDKKALI